MTVQWKHIGFYPEEKLVADIFNAWRWLIGDEDFKPIVCSRLGDVFFERTCGRVDWLSCSMGLLEQAAANRSEFEQLCNEGDEFSEWFGPEFVEVLHAADKVASERECYLFVTLPIFAECTYEPSNIAVVPDHEAFVGLAALHQQLAALPDGQSIQIKVVS